MIRLIDLPNNSNKISIIKPKNNLENSGEIKNSSPSPYRTKLDLNVRENMVFKFQFQFIYIYIMISTEISYELLTMIEYLLGCSSFETESFG